jgi:hypothetical protein
MRTRASGTKLVSMSDTHAGGNGQGPSGTEPGAGRAAESEPPDAEIGELALVCRRYVKRAIGVELDFSPETLPVLDYYVDQARRDARERPDLLGLMARVVGAYFGEVARRQFDLFWRMPSADAHTWQLCGHSVFLAISPIGVAYDALSASTEHAGPSSELRLAPDERELVEQRLASLPEVTEREYFLLATRLEVIETTVEALRAQMLQAGGGDIEFDLRDYELDPWA